MDKWAEVWLEGDEESQEDVLPILRAMHADRLDRSARDEFRGVCRSFKASTGIGVDRWHPKVWSQLSDVGVDAIVDSLCAVGLPFTGNITRRFLFATRVREA